MEILERIKLERLFPDFEDWKERIQEGMIPFDLASVIENITRVSQRRSSSIEATLSPVTPTEQAGQVEETTDTANIDAREASEAKTEEEQVDEQADSLRPDAQLLMSFSEEVAEKEIPQASSSVPEDTAGLEQGEVDEDMDKKPAARPSGEHVFSFTIQESDRRDPEALNRRLEEVVAEYKRVASTIHPPFDPDQPQVKAPPYASMPDKSNVDEDEEQEEREEDIESRRQRSFPEFLPGSQGGKRLKRGHISDEETESDGSIHASEDDDGDDAEAVAVETSFESETPEPKKKRAKGKKKKADTEEEESPSKKQRVGRSRARQTASRSTGGKWRPSRPLVTKAARKAPRERQPVRKYWYLEKQDWDKHVVPFSNKQSVDHRSRSVFPPTEQNFAFDPALYSPS